jgi:hypothetical protein
VEDKNQVRLFPYHHSMVNSQVVGGRDGLQLWWMAANIFKKQLQTADKGWLSSLGVEYGGSNPTPPGISLLRDV